MTSWPFHWPKFHFNVKLLIGFGCFNASIPPKYSFLSSFPGSNWLPPDSGSPLAAQTVDRVSVSGLTVWHDLLTNSTHGSDQTTLNRSNNFSFMSVVKLYFVKIYGGRRNFVVVLGVFMNDTVVNIDLSKKQGSYFFFVFWNITLERSFASNTLVSSLSPWSLVSKNNREETFINGCNLDQMLR